VGGVYMVLGTGPHGEPSPYTSQDASVNETIISFHYLLDKKERKQNQKHRDPE
jgi:hypothetical protein